MAIGYVLQAVKLACPAVLLGLLVGDQWSSFSGVFVGVLAWWILLALFVGERGAKRGV